MSSVVASSKDACANGEEDMNDGDQSDDGDYHVDLAPRGVRRGKRAAGVDAVADALIIASAPTASTATRGR